MVEGGEVRHEADHSRFVYLNAEKQQLGVLEYEQLTVNGLAVLDLQHTVVDPLGRGQGIAQKLCDAAFIHARELGIKVIPTCSYISDTYLKRTTLPNAVDLVHNASL